MSLIAGVETMCMIKKGQLGTLAPANSRVGAPDLHPTVPAQAQLLVAAVLCIALATVAWNRGVNRLGSQTGGLWQNTIPVFAVLISLLFFGVQPLAWQLIGSAVVLAGMLHHDQAHGGRGKQISGLAPAVLSAPLPVPKSEVTARRLPTHVSVEGEFARGR